MFCLYIGSFFCPEQTNKQINNSIKGKGENITLANHLILGSNHISFTELIKFYYSKVHANQIEVPEHSWYIYLQPRLVYLFIVEAD